MKALVGVTALLLAVTLTGCGSYKATAPTPDPVRQNANTYDYTEKHILLSDGRTVTCIEWAPNQKAGGISCDWDSISKKGTK